MLQQVIEYVKHSLSYKKNPWLLFYFFFVFVFGQVTCDATGQVLCLGPEYRARVLYYYTPLSLCALVETPHTKKGLLPRAPCLRKYFSKRVFFGMAVSVHGGDQKPKLIKFRTMLTRCQRESPPFTVSKISLAANSADPER